MSESLEQRLRGSWELLSRIDRTRDGQQREEPSLGSDPIALLFFDAAGRFAAQFMKRDRSNVVDAPATASNNSRARGGYDAYWGTYKVDEASGMVDTLIVAALSQENVGQTYRRHMRVENDTLTLELDTTSASGEPLRRTLTWKRVSR